MSTPPCAHPAPHQTGQGAKLHTALQNQDAVYKWLRVHISQAGAQGMDTSPWPGCSCARLPGQQLPGLCAVWSGSRAASYAYL